MSDGQVDLWAREQVGKLWSDLRALATDWWGPDKNNGRRSEMRAIADKLGELEISQRTLVGDLRHYLDTEREATCHGLKALAAYEASDRTTIDEEASVEVARIQAEANVKAAEVAARVAGEAGARTQRIVVVGVIATAVLSNLDHIVAFAKGLVQ